MVRLTTVSAENRSVTCGSTKSRPWGLGNNLLPSQQRPTGIHQITLRLM
jgi:hypothetical protein